MPMLCYFFVDGPLRDKMAKARVGRDGRWIRGHPPRRSSTVELLALSGRRHIMRVEAGGGNAIHRHNCCQRGWHLRPGNRDLAWTTTPIIDRRQGALDILVWRGTRPFWACLA